MREQEMRMRVFRFLRARMRNMIMPATVGIGLALGACEPVSKYMGPVPSDAAQTQRDVADKDSSVLVPTDVANLETSDSPRDIALSEPVPIYGDMGPMRDTAVDVGGVDVGSMDSIGTPDSGFDAGTIVAKYMGPILDAAGDGSLVDRYGAPNFDSGGAQPVYMAPAKG